MPRQTNVKYYILIERDTEIEGTEKLKRSNIHWERQKLNRTQWSLRRLKKKAKTFTLYIINWSRNVDGDSVTQEGTIKTSTRHFYNKKLERKNFMWDKQLSTSVSHVIVLLNQINPKYIESEEAYFIYSRGKESKKRESELLKQKESRKLPIWLVMHYPNMVLV